MTTKATPGGSLIAAGKITDRIDTPPFSHSVRIKLSSRFHFKYSFCMTGYKLKDKREMDWDFYLILLDELKGAGDEKVGMFYLRERAILLWLPDVIRAAKEASIGYLFLTTKGSLARLKSGGMHGSRTGWSQVTPKLC